MAGFLAVWNDYPADAEAAFERWYMGEHLLERLAVPGFRIGWRFEAIAADRRFFTLYEVDSPDVLQSAPYLERLNNPTPQTTSIMRRWQNMTRTVCTVASTAGRLDGAFALTCRFTAPPPRLPEAAQLLGALGDAPGNCKVQVWTGNTSGAGETVEARARGGADSLIAAAVVAQFARERDLERASRQLAGASFRAQTGMEGGLVGSYRMLCGLRGTH